MTTRITIEAIDATPHNGRYRVHHDGSVLIASAREPLFETCRALAAQGVVGRVEMWRVGGAQWDMASDIETGALLTVSEGPMAGPRFALWQEFEDAGEIAVSRSTGSARTGKRSSGARREPAEQTAAGESTRTEMGI